MRRASRKKPALPQANVSYVARNVKKKKSKELNIRAMRLIEIESQSRFETLRFANHKACDVDAILLCSRAYT